MEPNVLIAAATLIAAGLQKGMFDIPVGLNVRREETLDELAKLTVFMAERLQNPPR